MMVLNDLKQLLGEDHLSTIKSSILDILDNRIQNRYYVNKHFQNAIMNYFLEDYGSLYLRDHLEKQSNREVRRYLSSQVITQGFTGTKYMAMMNIYLEKHIQLGLLQQYRQLLQSVAEQPNIHQQLSQEYVSQAWKKGFALFVLAHSYDTLNLNSIFDIWNSLFPEDLIHRKRKPNSNLPGQLNRVREEVKKNTINKRNIHAKSSSVLLKMKKISKKQKSLVQQQRSHKGNMHSNFESDCLQQQQTSSKIQTPKTTTTTIPIDNLNNPFQETTSKPSQKSTPFDQNCQEFNQQLPFNATIVSSGGNLLPNLAFNIQNNTVINFQQPLLQQQQHQQIAIPSSFGLTSTGSLHNKNQQLLNTFSINQQVPFQQLIAVSNPSSSCSILPMQIVLGLNPVYLSSIQNQHPQQFQQFQQQPQILQYYQHKQAELNFLNQQQNYYHQQQQPINQIISMETANQLLGQKPLPVSAFSLTQLQL